MTMKHSDPGRTSVLCCVLLSTQLGLSSPVGSASLSDGGPLRHGLLDQISLLKKTLFFPSWIICTDQISTLPSLGGVCVHWIPLAETPSFFSPLGAILMIWVDKYFRIRLLS